MNYILTGITVSNAYGRLVQVIDGQYYCDGFGNPLNIGTGITGPTGGTGASINPMGQWDSLMIYYYLDMVYYNNSSYIYSGTTQSDHTPPNLNTNWYVIANSGNNHLIIW